MSRIALRLRRLEQEMCAAFACPACEDRGTLEVVFATPEDPQPKGEGCRRCGKINVLMVLKEASPPAGQGEAGGSR